MQEQQPTTPATTPAITTTTESPPLPAPVPAAPVVRKARGGRILNYALGGALVLAIAGVAFAVGRVTAPPTVSAGNFPNGGGQFFNGNGNGNGGNGQGGPGGFLAAGGITLEGTVESVTDTTLTLKTASGRTIQIALNGSTTYHAQSDASATDVTSGSTVLVRVNGFRAGGPDASIAPGNGGQTATDVTVVP